MTSDIECSLFLVINGKKAHVGTGSELYLEIPSRPK